MVVAFPVFYPKIAVQAWLVLLVAGSSCYFINDGPLHQGIYPLFLPHRAIGDISLTSSRTYVNNTLANATNRTHNNDVEKGLPTLQLEHPDHPHNDNNNNNRSWLRTPWSLLQRPLTSGRGGKKPSAPSLSAPSNTVCTNAWAGMSQSRASSEYVHTPIRKDFIRVRQEISQESELQEVV